MGTKMYVKSVTNVNICNEFWHTGAQCKLREYSTNRKELISSYIA